MQKLIDWLLSAQNAAAIQAVAAVAGFLVTLLLFFVTAWYVRLTHSLSLTATGQLHASLQPNLVFGFVEGGKTKSTVCRIDIRNAGNTAVRIRRAFIESIAECEVGDTVRFHHFEIDSDLAAVVLPADQSCTAQVDISDKLREKGILDPASGFTKVRWVLYLSCSDLLGLTQHGFMFDTEEALYRYRSPFEAKRTPVASDYLNIAEVTYPDGVPHIGVPVGAAIRFEMRKTGVHELFDVDPGWLRRLTGRAARLKRNDILRKQNGLVGLERLRYMFSPEMRTDAITSLKSPGSKSNLVEQDVMSQPTSQVKKSRKSHKQHGRRR